MPHFDLALPELERYRSALVEPPDFDSFWTRTLGEARDAARPVECQRLDSPLTDVAVYDVRFSGFGGQRIAAWLLLPSSARTPAPVVVSFLGYGGGRGIAESWTQFPAAGFAQLVVDSRGQGSGYRPGDTEDSDFTGPHAGGVMTLGIDSPAQYYYRRLFTDAVLALDALPDLPGVDASTVLLQGGSQGGGIALAVAGLSTVPLGAMIDVPFLCDIPRAIRLVDSFPYGELVRYLRVHRDAVEKVERTLSYFDGVHFAARAHASALFSVGLMDEVCPPSTVYAAYNVYSGAKQMAVYPFNGHENGEEVQALRALRWATELTARD
ncbi:acetylxylan esterase [Microcella daejeonensis]|uniref:acetylxylan esterase n=1 Tax=Microcella daejeonensis TaxID=2994971 RepID=UPI00226FB6BE|nr:acetylxylan esterase [Microcella daejeonensis]WAB84998.1 acetylxylan esterase [Microcella daejeonensis]